jgi:anti-sigma factor RsiW
MRLYVDENDAADGKSTGSRIYIQMNAASRRELASAIGAEHFEANGKRYHVRDIKAEEESDNTALSAVVGALIGLMAGMPGVLAGTFLGGLYGSAKTQEERSQAENFNRSEV